MTVSLITAIDDTAANSAVREAVSSVATLPMVRQKLAWGLLDGPALLTGEAVHGSPRLIALVERLRAGGVSGVVMAAMPVLRAADLPAVVLSQLLDLHLSTATPWTAAAGSPAAD
ncbi:hypothetical protein ACFYP0_27900 [Micromonospora arida]|uniref:hypothetical protein n=1 Tax=Micromonospora arida TaxID=2203715 RepID=UPI0033AB3618